MELQKYIKSTFDRLFHFVIRQRCERTLTPTQARLLRNLEHISVSELGTVLDDPSFEPCEETETGLLVDQDVDYDDLERPGPQIPVSNRRRIWLISRNLRENRKVFQEFEELGLNLDLSEV